MRDVAPLFLDSAYVLARVNRRDQWHQAAVRWEARVAPGKRRLVTTEFVLTEVGDGLAAVALRAQATRAIDVRRANPVVETVPASSELFAAALALYRARSDKDWGLTDCSSFAVMTERGLKAALTADAHFRQAGFQALLREDPSG